jgi:hypothetical protein
MTSVPNPVTILVGGVVVHRCDPRNVVGETVARRISELPGTTSPLDIWGWTVSEREWKYHTV